MVEAAAKAAFNAFFYCEGDAWREIARAALTAALRITIEEKT
jgi:hypothetical protein